MRNKIFFTILCFAILGTTVQAECTLTKTSSENCGQSACQKTDGGCSVESVKKIICTKDADVNAPQEALRYKKYVKQLQEERAVIYNALNLSDEQIQKREELIKQNASFYEEKFQSLMKESFKLRALKSANVAEPEIIRQRRIVNNIKAEISKMLEDEDKCFKKSLNRQQRSKYSLINKLEQNDFRRQKHQKDYYKSNPQMVPFGNPTPYSCSTRRK